MATRPGPTLIGAVFPNRRSAAGAADELRAAGHADQNVTSAVWSENDYVIDSHAGQNLQSGLLKGSAIGAGVGTVIGALLAIFVWPDLSAVVAIIGGIFFGASFGWFWGAYAGFNRYRPQLWQQQDWSHLSLSEGEVLVVISVDDGHDEAGAILERHGGRRVQPVHPA